MKISASFLKLVILFAVTTLLITLCAVVAPAFVHGFTWAILAYFILMTSFCHFLMSRAAHKTDPYDFYNYAMSTIAIRLLISAIVLFIYYYKFKEHTYLFTATFFILYFTFTGFEIRLLLSKLQEKEESSHNTDEKV